jgi:tetratricopeptide (TPR) repeat protein
MGGTRRMSDIKQLYREAWNLYFMERYDSSITLLKKILEIEPNHADALSSIGTNYYGKDDEEEAAKCIEQALLLDPDNSLAYTVRGMIAECSEDHSEARSNYDQALRYSPGSWFTRVRSGINYYYLGRLKEAFIELNTEIARIPNNYYACYHKGRLLSLEGEYYSLDRAAQALSKAIEFNRHYVTAYAQRGLVYIDQKKFTEALADFCKVIDINPAHDTSLFNRGYCLSELGRWDESISAYTYLINKNGPESNTGSILNRGLAYCNIQNYDAAIDDFSTLIQLDPESVLPLFTRGWVHLQKQNYDAAIDDYNAVLLLDPQDTESLKHLLEAYEKKGEYSKALAVTAHLRQILPLTKYVYEDPATQYFSETVFNHFSNVMLPLLQKNGERFIRYWEVRMLWGARENQTVREGTTMTHHEGSIGAGYLVLAENNIWIINIGVLSDRYCQKIGFFTGMFIAALGNIYDDRKVERTDKIFAFPHSDIQYVKYNDNVFTVGYGSDVWEISPYFGDVHNSLLAALKMSRKDIVSSLWEPLATPPEPKFAEVQSSDDVYSKIEKLKKLMDAHAISQEMYDRKVQELLDKI